MGRTAPVKRSRNINEIQTERDNFAELLRQASDALQVALPIISDIDTEHLSPAKAIFHNIAKDKVDEAFRAIRRVGV
jgi:hypothetical protein